MLQLACVCGCVSLSPVCACNAAGRGRQVISVCKSADLLLMVLDASKPAAHREARVCLCCIALMFGQAIAAGT